jgi:tellurite resistance protein
MSRWENVESLFAMSTELKNHDKFLEIFTKPKNYLPQSEQEKIEFEEFSLVASSMAILIHIALADSVLKGEEREQIVTDLLYQLEQRPYEFSKLSEKFGKSEREIISKMFDKLANDYLEDLVDLDKIIDTICMIYQNNMEKKFYIIRLCYFCALSDYDFDDAERTAIKDIAAKLNISTDDMYRIENEVKQEVIVVR